MMFVTKTLFCRLAATRSGARAPALRCASRLNGALGIRQRLTLLVVLLGLPGCQQKMAHQPSYRPLQASDFFADGRASRPLEPGTIARRNSYQNDPQLDSGRIDDGGEAARFADLVGPRQALGVLAAAAVATNAPTRYFDTFPFQLSQDDLNRGRERFNIFCAVCHDRLGTGNGVVVQRGFPKPPSYLTDRSRGLQFQGVQVSLREAPVGYLFEVVTRGFGAMPAYAAQVPPRDRWLIVAYIRALQQRDTPVPLQDLPPEERQQIEKKLNGGEGKE
jgi:mono/diheme cytochrome c family protein